MRGKYISQAEAAEYLGMSVKTVRRYISEGRLTGFRLGNQQLRVDRDEVEALFKPIPTAAGR